MPVSLSGEALKKYYVPQQEIESTAQPNTQVSPDDVSEDVYDRFQTEIKDYKKDDKKKLEDHFLKQVQKAKKERNKEAEAHYERLIGIINTN